MANRKLEHKLLYDSGLISERITNLRKGNGVNGLTLKQLQKGILEKTGVSITDVQLSKYENSDLKERMNINNALALADYYNVSLDYLIGRSNTKSIDQQNNECEKFAERNGYTIIDYYSDEAKTGTNDNRPGFQRMISDSKSGCFQYVIIYKIDRFARDRYDSAHYKAALKRMA